jgi:DNA-directed RNA polymerase subunit RPC12/RpoP
MPLPRLPAILSRSDGTQKRYIVSGVRCHHCGTFVALRSMDRLSQEFAVKCQQCGRRNFYTQSELIQTGDVRSQQPLTQL